MVNENQVPEYRNNNTLGVLTGLMVGCMAGAAAMLLLAPQSGKDTRRQIQEKGIELRDRSSEMMEDVMAQVRSDKKKITMEGRHKAKELLQNSQTLVAEQLDRVSNAALAGKKAIQNS